MTSRDRIQQKLSELYGPVCDDCLSDIAILRQRQVANQICRLLAGIGNVSRGSGKCSLCGKAKIVNMANQSLMSVSPVSQGAETNFSDKLANLREMVQSPEAFTTIRNNTLVLPLRYTWHPVHVDGKQYCYGARFDHTLIEPAVYRWTVSRNQVGDLRVIYIGETEQLARRIYHYHKPGPSQRTNIRLRNDFIKQGNSGHRIALETLHFDPFLLAGHQVSTSDLTSKFLRRCLESLLIFHYIKEGYTVLNA